MTCTFDWSNYTGNLNWLPGGTILLTKHGSQAYGTSLPSSDLDVKGVAIPPPQYFHGFAHRFEQAESKNPDLVVYDVRKFFNLAADCNPNIVEVLWTSTSDWLQVTEAGLRLAHARSLFLSKKAKHTFSGYATAQLKRIQTHNRWLLRPPAAPPTRVEYGLPEHALVGSDERAAAEAAVLKQVEAWDVDLACLEKSERIALEGKIATALAEMKISADEKWNLAGRWLGFSEDFIDALGRERRYRAAHKEWEQYLSWQKNRNAARAELEAKYGYDCKHGMHLVRLMRMCREILETGQVIVKRPDAEELLAIRNGAWSFDQLVEWAQREDAALDEVAKRSSLPYSPDRGKLDALCVEIVEDHLKAQSDSD